MRLTLRHLVTALALAAATGCAASDPQTSGHSGEKAGACVTCHLPEYQSASHHVGEKPTTCQICHVQDAWHPTGVHHPWPLDGAHAKAKCFDCHKGTPAVFKGTPKACAGCHQADYDKAADHPGHFALTCQDCHTTTAWKTLVPSPKWPTGSAPSATPTATATTSPTSTTKPPAPKPPKPSPTHPQPTPPPAPTPDTTSTASKRY